MGGGVGRWPMEGGQGGRWGGAPKSSAKGVPLFGSLKNLIWLVWGDGGGVGRWPMEGGQGGRWGGAPESSVGANKKMHWFTLFEFP